MTHIHPLLNLFSSDYFVADFYVMDTSGIVTSICSVLDKLMLHSEVIYVNKARLQSRTGVLIYKLRGLRTFVLCSRYVNPRIKDSNGLELANSNTLMHGLSILQGYVPWSSRPDLTVRVEDVVFRILKHGPFANEHECDDYIIDIESLEEEIDDWYISTLSDYSQLSGSPVANEVEVIADSVAQNLEDFLSCYAWYYVLPREPISVLKEKITFLRNFIRFATLCRAQQLKFKDLLIHVEAVALNAAHLTLHLLSTTECFSSDLTESMISALLLRISPVDNHILHEMYARVLEILEHSQVLNGDDPLRIMKDFIEFLLCALWEILQLDTGPVVFKKDKLQALYEGLRFLRTIFRIQPNKFDHKLMDIAGAAICDAGVVIFSLHRSDFVIDRGLGDFFENIKAIQTEVVEDQDVKTCSFPNTNVLGSLDLLNDYLADVKSCKVDSGTLSCMPKLQENLNFLRSFMGKLAELRIQQEDLHQGLWKLGLQVAYKMECLIDQLVLGEILDSFPMMLQSITENIESIENDSKSIFDGGKEEIKVQRFTWSSSHLVPSHRSALKADQIVGFEAESESIIDRLKRGLNKLQTVAIVGMPGLGKTTLATKVFNDPAVGYHFNVRAWCSVSQEFDRRKVLLELLNQIEPGSSNSAMNEDDLSQKLWRSLKGRRYLIFMDDIWEADVFHLLKGSLPDDHRQSRILLTSRNGDVAILDEEPHHLRLLEVSESTELLERKLFPDQKDLPSSWNEFGTEIADYCKGLPLTLILVAGLLKTTKQEVWKDVLGNLRSDIRDQCERTIDLSYKHLPDHLKPCFLSLGAFPEDQEYSVKTLIWLWIAQGFARERESKSLEEAAEDNLKNLIDRNLVMIAKESSNGGVKTFRMHDLLHDFCMIKAGEENFVHLLKVCRDKEQEISYFDEPVGKLRRLCIYSNLDHFKEWKLFCPSLRCLQFSHPGMNYGGYHDISFIFRMFKLLRVLDIERVGLIEFPIGLENLLQLRYLAIQLHSYVSPLIGKLSNLEILILFSNERFILPDTFWNLQKLRHFYIVCRSYGSDEVELPANNIDSYSDMLQLESLPILRSTDWSILEKQLRKLPNIRRLKCVGRTVISHDDSRIRDFSFLSKLGSLSLRSYGDFEILFPENIKKLSLNSCELDCLGISRIGNLPSLEVLKLESVKFMEGEWHVEEGGFLNLKFLRMESLDIVKWTASDDQFINLEKLVMESCSKLEEIPECLENIPTLAVIEAYCCSDAATYKILKIEEFQKDMGNSVLKLNVHWARKLKNRRESYVVRLR